LSDCRNFGYGRLFAEVAPALHSPWHHQSGSASTGSVTKLRQSALDLDWRVMALVVGITILYSDQIAALLGRPARHISSKQLQ
jgi:hypothetical protein